MIEWVRSRRDKFWELQQNCEYDPHLHAYYRGQWAAYHDVLFRMGAHNA